MTYPPQQGGPQWGPPPGPYQPGYGPPPNQPGYGVPPSPYPPGYGPPPKKRRTVLWIVLGCVALLLVAGIGITGFVAPGFFVNHDRPIGAPGNLDARTMLDQFVAKLNARDGEGAAQYGCESGDAHMFQSIRTTLVGPDQTGYRVANIEPEGGTTVMTEIDYSYTSDPSSTGEIRPILRQGPDGGFCIFGII